MNRTLPLALAGALLLTAGCNTQRGTRAQAERPALADRAAFIDQRAQELIRRGTPKDAALAKASGEWFEELETATRRAKDNPRAEQRLLENKLAQMSRERADGAR